MNRPRDNRNSHKFNYHVLDDRDAFMRHYDRQHKDAKWKSDVHSYSLWKRIAENYDSEHAKKRMAELQAKWPGKSLG